MNSNQDFRAQLIKRALLFAKKTIRLVDKFPRKNASKVISDQLLRSATSIGANIVEAQAASSKKDFINFLTHALKSGNETKFWLVLAKELNMGIQEEVESLAREVEELTKILGSSIATLKGKKKN